MTIKKLCMVKIVAYNKLYLNSDRRLEKRIVSTWQNEPKANEHICETGCQIKQLISFTDFPKACPARMTYEVSRLPLGAAVEIEAIALCGDLVIAEAGPCPCAR